MGTSSHNEENEFCWRCAIECVLVWGLIFVVGWSAVIIPFLIWPVSNVLAAWGVGIMVFFYKMKAISKE